MSTQAATSEPPKLQVADQDPLPESNWLYRRWLALCTAGVIGVIHLTVLRVVWLLVKLVATHPDPETARTAIAAIEGLLKFSGWLILFNALSYLLYLTAPSAEHVGKWIASIVLLRGGGKITSSASAEAPDGSRVEAETVTTAGKGEPATEPTPETPAPDPNK